MQHIEKRHGRGVAADASMANFVTSPNVGDSLVHVGYQTRTCIQRRARSARSAWTQRHNRTYRANGTHRLKHNRGDRSDGSRRQHWSNGPDGSDG